MGAITTSVTLIDAYQGTVFIETVKQTSSHWTIGHCSCMTAAVSLGNEWICAIMAFAITVQRKILTGENFG